MKDSRKLRNDKDTTNYGEHGGGAEAEPFHYPDEEPNFGIARGPSGAYEDRRRPPLDPNVTDFGGESGSKPRRSQALPSARLGGKPGKYFVERGPQPKEPPWAQKNPASPYFPNHASIPLDESRAHRRAALPYPMSGTDDTEAPKDPPWVEAPPSVFNKQKARFIAENPEFERFESGQKWSPGDFTSWEWDEKI